MRKDSKGVLKSAGELQAFLTWCGRIPERIWRRWLLLIEESSKRLIRHHWENTIEAKTQKDKNQKGQKGQKVQRNLIY